MLCRVRYRKCGVIQTVQVLIVTSVVAGAVVLQQLTSVHGQLQARRGVSGWPQAPNAHVGCLVPAVRHPPPSRESNIQGKVRAPFLYLLPSSSTPVLRKLRHLLQGLPFSGIDPRPPYIPATSHLHGRTVGMLSNALRNARKSRTLTASPIVLDGPWRASCVPVASPRGQTRAVNSNQAWRPVRVLDE